MVERWLEPMHGTSNNGDRILDVPFRWLFIFILDVERKWRHCTVDFLYFDGKISKMKLWKYSVKINKSLIL